MYLNDDQEHKEDKDRKCEQNTSSGLYKWIRSMLLLVMMLILLPCVLAVSVARFNLMLLLSIERT